MEPTWSDTAISPRSLFLRWNASNDGRIVQLKPSAAQYRTRALLIGLTALALLAFAFLLPENEEAPRQRSHFVIIIVLAAIVMMGICLRYCLASFRFRRNGRELSIDYDAGEFRVSESDRTTVVPLSSINGLHLVQRGIESQLYLLHGIDDTLWLHTDINSGMYPLIESFREIVNLPLVSQSTFDPKLR